MLGKQEVRTHFRPLPSYIIQRITAKTSECHLCFTEGETVKHILCVWEALPNILLHSRRVQLMPKDISGAASTQALHSTL